MTDINKIMADKVVGKKVEKIEDKMEAKLVATLELPFDVVHASSGFSLDIGDTTAKLVYRDKSDFTDGQPRNKDQVKFGKIAIQMTSFPSEDVETIVNYINRHCDVTSHEHSGHFVFFTSTTEDKGKAIREKLDFPTKFLNKIGCYAAGMCYLVKHMLQEEVFRPLSQQGILEGESMTALYRAFQVMLESGGQGRLLIKEKLETPNITSPFPVILTICDSQFDYIRGYLLLFIIQQSKTAVFHRGVQVEEDGQFQLLDSCNFGWQSFLALTKYLTDMTDHDEINTLVEHSSGATVDSFAEELVKPGLDDDPYSKLQIKARLFPFGKAHSQPEDVEHGDVMHSLLQSICEMSAQVGYQVCQTQGITLNYYCGGLMETAKARQFMTGMMHLRQHIMESQVDYQFLKHGDFLAAIGAFIEPYVQQHRH